MKDIYDLVILYNECVNSQLLWVAIETTFRIRQTILPASIHNTVVLFDLTALKKAWINISKNMNNILFDNLWLIFLDILKKIDKSRIGYRKVN